MALLGTAAEAVTTQADAAGGCDGVKNGEWGFHTGESQDPWWQVDLGETQAIARVMIWNRTAAAERARQIRVLLSEDGKTFRQVYQHDGTVFYGFADGKPLVVELHGQAGGSSVWRSPGKSYFHLDEVEVFGVGDPRREPGAASPCGPSQRFGMVVCSHRGHGREVDWAALRPADR